MKKLTKIISIFLTIIMLYTTITVSNLQALTSKAVETAQFSYYHYYVDNGNAIIYNVDKDISGDVVIPATINGYPVTELTTSISTLGWSNYGSNWGFENCTKITSITIPDSVISIGDDVFNNCTELKSINIPNSVTSIGDSVFAGCINLATITVEKNNEFYYNIENSNTIIEADTNTLIAGCKNTIIPNTVTSIGNGAFQGCTELTNITIPNTVTSIDEYAFYNCTGLTNITIPDNVISIGHNAFNGCTELTNITIPNSVTSIGDYAFSSCTKLTNITIPDGVTSIEYGTFYGCTGLTNITIPDGVTSIETSAFEGCTGLTSINLPDSITSIWRSAFNDTAYYNNENNWDNGILYINNHLIKANSEKVSGEVEIKSGTRSIANNTFSSCTELTNITIPDSVTSIGDYAFSGCTELTNITIPDSVTSIEYGTFQGCTRLTNITIPDSVTSVESNAFNNTAYYNNKNNWDNGILYINNHLIVADNEKISNKVEIKTGTKTIAHYAFMECSNLTEITIPEGVISIGEAAFFGTNLTNIFIPSTVETINIGLSNENLVKIEVSENNKYYDSRNNCNAIIETKSNTLIQGCLNTIIPNNVTSIGIYAFSYFYKLSNITIPEGITSIGEAAFAACTSLTNVILPESVSIVDICAFAACTNLESVTFYNPYTEIRDYAFDEASPIIYGYENSTAQKYAKENNLEFISLGDYNSAHEHSFEESITKAASCTEEGEKTLTCSCGEKKFEKIAKLDHELGDWYVTKTATCTEKGTEQRDCRRANCTYNDTREIPLSNHKDENIDYHCDECSVELCNHTTTIVEGAKQATCIEDGYTGDTKCDTCGDIISTGTVITKLNHSFGDWTVTKEATFILEGEKTRTCTECSEKETTSIPKLVPTQEAVDTASNISVKFLDNSFEDEISLEVTEEFEGHSFNIINTEFSNFKSCIFDINVKINGEKVQPNGKILVGIPLPEGYNAAKTQVYFITNEEYNLQRMKSFVEDGKIWFETDHFSSYAIVDETETDVSPACSHLCHKTGFMSFIWKIVRFFWKLFRVNPICECGAAHY